MATTRSLTPFLLIDGIYLWRTSDSTTPMHQGSGRPIHHPTIAIKCHQFDSYWYHCLELHFGKGCSVPCGKDRLLLCGSDPRHQCVKQRELLWSLGGMEVSLWWTACCGLSEISGRLVWMEGEGGGSSSFPFLSLVSCMACLLWSTLL